MELVIQLTTEDLGQLSAPTVEEIMALIKSKAGKPKQGARRAIKKRLAITYQPSDKQVTQEAVLEAIRTNPGLTVRELTSKLYPPELDEVTAINRCTAHITKLSAEGRVQRKGQRPTRLYPRRRPAAQAA